jgi:hypothetical protein
MAHDLRALAVSVYSWEQTQKRRGDFRSRKNQKKCINEHDNKK